MKKEHSYLPIYLERLAHEHVEKISEALPPELFQLSESDELQAHDTVAVTAEAYVSDGFLIITYSVSTAFTTRCGFCNESFSLPVQLSHCTVEIPLDEIKHGYFDFSELLRQELLLQVPYYPLCGGEQCNNRAEVEKYLKK